MSNVVPIRLLDAEGADSALGAPADGHHLVRFYETEEFLFDAVVRFLGAGLADGDLLIVIATPGHRDGFVGRLDPVGVQDAMAEGRLVLLDARETLARFMVNRLPDRDRFRGVLDEVLAPARGRAGKRVRAYGEMVDLLWRDGLPSAAILLEELWNEAYSRHRFSLLCAYVMANFYKQSDSVGIVDVCRAHSHVLPYERPSDSTGIPGSLTEGEVGRLRERVRALEFENQRFREMEQALRRSAAERVRDGEVRFRLLVESVKDYAIFMLDPSGIVTSWNIGAENIKGYKADEIIGRHFSAFYPAEDIEAGKCEWELEVATREGRFEDEGWRLRKDGGRFWANVVITPLRDSTGAAIGFAKVTRDLTERVGAEQERLRLARMEDAERRKDEFLAIMGHELRNPLAPLQTAAHMIRLRGGRATENEMGIVDRQLRHMTKIVNDLLNASRAMREKIELSPEVMEIGEILANAVDLASPLIEERRHELLIDVPDQSLTVNVDPERMAQAFGNILNNAAKYTEPGGTIRIRAARRADDVEVTVADSGQGIAPQVIGRIFDLFTQGDQGLERKSGGLGIGLAVARKMVREHQGEIEAQSDGVGRGSRFTVRLPHAAPRPRSLPPPAASTTRVAAARRVLIADDNRDSVEMMRALFEHSGHSIRVALDGLEALQICADFKPDIVFLDIGLPEMDGYEVAKRMRAIPSCEKIRIVAVSGYARPEDRARAFESGFTDHLAKPVDVARLSTMLESPPPSTGQPTPSS